MPAIDWSRSGSAGQGRAFFIVIGFCGQTYSDDEIGNEDSDLTPDAFYDWVESNIDSDLRNDDANVWKKMPPSQTVMLNARGSGPANVLASYRTTRGDRIEYYVGCGSEVNGDTSCLLQTASGHVLIAGVVAGRPYVCCDILDYGKNGDDGFTHPVELDLSTGGALVRTLIESATEYLFNGA